MDWVSIKGRSAELLKKYRYVLLILLVGIFLMTLPEGKQEEPQPQQPTQEAPESLQDSLSDILGKIAGAGKVEVLLTQSTGAETLYQTDEDCSVGENSSDTRRDTVLVTNSSREETGLIRRIDPPTYQGAIVLCQGAENAKVKLAIVEAVAGVTGLTTDKITVLKMK